MNAFIESGNLLARVRKTAKMASECKDTFWGRYRTAKRKIEILQATKSPFIKRQVEALEQEAKEAHSSYKDLKALLIDVGELLVKCSHLIDGSTTLEQRCQLLNVNVADRGGLTEDAGIIELIYAHSVENSAENRGKEKCSGPLRAAVLEFIRHQLIHNEEFKDMAHNKLFGTGGMFEFVPSYSQQPDGTMKRNLPKLREAVPEDADRANAA